MSYRGIDIREAAGGLLFRAFLQDAVGALLTSGATTLRLYELQTDGTIKSYDFADNTFKTTALTTATLGMTHRTGNNGTVNTGIWSVALTTLTGFTAGMTYFAAVNNTGASPPDQVREFQYGSGVLADMVAVGGTAQTAGDICGKIGTPVDLGNGIATLAGNMSDIDTEADAIIGYVTNIATVGSPTYASSSSFTLTTGNQTSGTYVNTDTANQVYHVITDAAGTLSIIYGFTLRPDEVASTLTWIGRWNGTNDTLLFEIYDWTGTPGYRTWFTQTGVSGTTSASDFTKTLNLVSKYTGTGANIGKVNVRISGTGLTSCTLSTDQLIVGKSNTSQSVGYADGAVWVKATGTSGTTLYFNGTADNPCPWSDAQTIASALGTSRFRILNGETVTLNASTASKSLIGSNWTIALAGQVVSGAYIEGAEVSGTGTSVAQTEFMHCHINAGTTLGPSRFYHCGFSGTSGSKVTAGSAGEFLLIDCFSEVAGSGTPYFTFAGTGGTTGVNIRRWSGGSNVVLDSNCTLTMEVVTGGGQTITTGGANVEIRGIPRSVTLVVSASETCQFDGVTGPVSVSGTATAATVNLYGVTGAVTNTATGCTVNNLASSQATLNVDSAGVTSLLSRFLGITSLAQWLGLLAGKQVGNSTARSEVRATGAGSGTFDETTDSQEAVRDSMALEATLGSKIPHDIPMGQIGGTGPYLVQADVKAVDGAAATFLTDPVSADVVSVDGSTAAATSLKDALATEVGGTVNDVSPAVTGFKTSLQPADAQFYANQFLVFTSGALVGQSRKIGTCSLDGGYLVVAWASGEDSLTAAPANGTSFRITGRSK